MEEALENPLPAIASVVTVVAFLGGVFTTSEAVVALGVIGFAYFFVVLPVVFAIGIGRELRAAEGARWTARAKNGAREASGSLFALGFWLLLIAASWPLRLPDAELHRFGMLQVFGVLALIIALAVLALWWRLAHRTRRKICPDCAETVRAPARVCRHCGYRWQPRPPSMPL